MSDIEITRSVEIPDGLAAQNLCRKLPPGFPIFSDTETGQVLHESTLFLSRRLLGRFETGHLLVTAATVSALAYDHRDFLRFLIKEQKAVERLAAKDLYDYAATMTMRPSPITGDQYAQGTVARRVRLAVEFAAWLCERGIGIETDRAAILDLANRLPVNTHLRGNMRGYRRSAHVRSTLLPMQSKDHEPTILTQEQVQILLSQLSLPSRPESEVEQALAKRNCLMAKLALCAGLRREEVCNVSLGSIAAIVITSSEKRLMPLRLTKTKNSRIRNVLVPAPFVLALQQFVNVERKALVPAGIKNPQSLKEPLFPPLRRSRKGQVRPMTTQNFSLVVRQACLRAGLVTRVPAQAAGKRVELVTKPAFSIHDLRHTYAVWTYLLLRSSGDPNPWLYLQAQLGHRSSQTTIDVYLRAVRLFEVAVSDKFLNFATEIIGWTEQ
ncbi:MAG TPA: site-specific integrase [Rhodanobacteraceae bacterium]|jgi:integrase/recombinase XerC|nr:site-specific integrase [Rhodanobacteraceae bacterium]